ncbi:MAG: YfcC family protein [Clostridia bacterium]|nr:YfcC family protein [Clostridia bacterium]
MTTNTKEKSSSAINLKSFLTVAVILCVLIAVAGILSNVIPKGSYDYTETGEIIAGSYVQLGVKGIELWRIITAPIRVFFSEDGLNIVMISLFLVIMSGVFNVMEKTGGVKALIKRGVAKFSHKKTLVLCITILGFMVFGSFFGMFEELCTLLPIIVVFTLSIGYDTMTGLGICMLSACFGFSAAITNPFSVGLASQMAGTHVFDGVWLRLILFALIYGIICFFILSYVKKISKNPQKSLTYELDIEKLKTIDLNGEANPNEERLFKIYGIFFLIEFVVLILIASIREISGYAIVILAITFLIGGFVTGSLAEKSFKKVCVLFLDGAVAMLPAVVMIALASSVKLILDESQITPTIMNAVITYLSGKNKFVCVLLIYALILVLQLFIGSSSAKIMLIMPLLVPICSALGLTPATLILTYCIADGFTDMIIPTNPVLLIGLSITGVSYGKWLKWTYKLQIAVFILTILILFVAVGVNL